MTLKLHTYADGVYGFVEVSVQFFLKRPGGMRGSLLRLLSSLVKGKVLVCPSIILDAMPGVGSIVCV